MFLGMLFFLKVREPTLQGWETPAQLSLSQEDALQVRVIRAGDVAVLQDERRQSSLLAQLISNLILK